MGIGKLKLMTSKFIPNRNYTLYKAPTWTSNWGITLKQSIKEIYGITRIEAINSPLLMIIYKV